jgi:hypothetical protein
MRGNKMKKLLTIASVLVGLTISFNLLANSDIHLDHAELNIGGIALNTE